MNDEEILEKLNKKEIKIHEIENLTNHVNAALLRKKFINQQNVELNSIDRYNFSAESIYKKNCENLIGGVSIPVGIAGPLAININNKISNFYIPLATTEGALVASINRGMKLISKAGGVNTTHKNFGMTRAPVFKTKNLEKSLEFERFIKDNFEQLKKVTEATSNHLTLKDTQVFINGRSVWVRFVYDTQDAMGMNMVGKATDAAATFILSRFDVKLIALSGNVCVDKKPSQMNNILGRGRGVQAEIFITKETLEEVMKCDIETFYEVGLRKNYQGSIISGSTGFNSQAANIISAIFLATGQDIAHAVDASNTITNVEHEGDGIYFNINIPNLNIGTVGGGTTLGAQNELLNLALKSIDGEIDMNKTELLARIIGATVLAGEISLNGALANNTLACAHDALGRSKK